MPSRLRFFDFSKKINYKTELLAGITVAMTMIPESLSFAILAGFPPLVGLYAAFIMGIVTSIFGGRPGLISGGAGRDVWLCKRVGHYHFHGATRAVQSPGKWRNDVVNRSTFIHYGGFSCLNNCHRCSFSQDQQGGTTVVSGDHCGISISTWIWNTYKNGQ